MFHRSPRHPSLIAPMFTAALLVLVGCGTKPAPDTKGKTSFYAFETRTLDDEPLALSAFKGKVVLVVNTASKCGLTPQYEGLQALYEQYSAKGLVVLGVPCNQFKNQEPGNAEQIKEFCDAHYDVTFPMTQKTKVNGSDRHPLYTWLTKQSTKPQSAGDITWNFEKFLIGRDGQVKARFAPKTEPKDPAVIKAVEDALAA